MDVKRTRAHFAQCFWNYHVSEPLIPLFSPKNFSGKAIGWRARFFKGATSRGLLLGFPRGPLRKYYSLAVKRDAISP